MRGQIIKTLFLVVLGLSFGSCSTEDTGLEVALIPEEPIAIFADVPLLIQTGPGEFEEITIEGPWSLVGFNFSNSLDQTITIIAVTMRVSSAFTQEVDKLVENVFVDSAGNLNPLPRSFFAQICSTSNPSPTCLASNDPSPAPQGDGLKIYLQGMGGDLGEEQDPSDLRNAVFFGELVMEGWTGPFEAPDKNFLQIVPFVAQASF